MKVNKILIEKKILMSINLIIKDFKIIIFK